MSCLLWSKEPHFTTPHILIVFLLSVPPLHHFHVFIFCFFKHFWPCIFHINHNSIVYRLLFLATAGALTLITTSCLSCWWCGSWNLLYWTCKSLEDVENAGLRKQQNWSSLIFFLRSSAENDPLYLCHLVFLLQVLFIYCNIYLLTFDLMGALYLWRLLWAICGL